MDILNIIIIDFFLHLGISIKENSNNNLQQFVLYKLYIIITIIIIVIIIIIIISVIIIIIIIINKLLKVKNDHRSEFSNLSNWKEEA